LPKSRGEKSANRLRLQVSLVSDFLHRVISARRFFEDRISGITRISAVAVLLTIPSAQDILKAATLSPPLEVANETEGPNLQRSDGLVCYKGKELISPAGDMSFQALYFTVGQYHCVRRYGLSKRLLRAMVDPSTTKTIGTLLA
jgi:hypothetical protein